MGNCNAYHMEKLGGPEETVFKRTRRGGNIPKLCFTLVFTIPSRYVMACFESFQDYLIRKLVSQSFARRLPS